MTESGMEIGPVATGAAAEVEEFSVALGAMAEVVAELRGTLEKGGGAAVTMAPRAKMLNTPERRTMVTELQLRVVDWYGSSSECKKD